MQKHPEAPVSVYPDVLAEDRYKSLLAELSQSHLEMHQPYPKRLFSKPEHEPWLRGYFEDFIATLKTHTGHDGLYVQQIFLGMELPDSGFLLHRSHPNIAAVAVYSLEDFVPVQLHVLTNSHDDPEDYLWGRKDYKFVPFAFKENEAIVVHNSHPRYHWGFSSKIGQNTIKRSIWIYFGK